MRSTPADSPSLHPHSTAGKPRPSLLAMTYPAIHRLVSLDAFSFSSVHKHERRMSEKSRVTKREEIIVLEKARQIAKARGCDRIEPQVRLHHFCSRPFARRLRSSPSVSFPQPRARYELMNSRRSLCELLRTTNDHSQSKATTKSSVGLHCKTAIVESSDGTCPAEASR